jgi:hypothetical protein
MSSGLMSLFAVQPDRSQSPMHCREESCMILRSPVAVAAIKISKRRFSLLPVQLRSRSLRRPPSSEPISSRDELARFRCKRW